ncbi:haloacid dehalogenase [Dechloromonas denitrificans]|uniref:Haloacid dehalogenase n=1 Tax=Dechloromonas denitrificans TaxID=281362 RepID=A0A133XJH0_9RHOO|nr:HAD hydrolase-like protein [Dechloromonas denitrificans]KXB31077.1 haloacid dehalogenase [Dechloromonas denitrificans]
MKYRLAIFDFDGTLADSLPFLLSVINRLAERHAFKPIDLDAVPAFRHCSAREMMRHLDLPAWKLPVVAQSFMALMQQNPQATPLFANVDAVLQQLAQAEIRLALVSSNARDNVERILGAANIGLLSHLECGMSIFGKACRIRKILRQTSVPASEAIYIGDQITDLEAARQEGVAFGAVTWGYGSIESLRQHAPDEEFAQFTDLLRIAD